MTNQIPSMKDLAEFLHIKRAEKAELKKEQEKAMKELDDIIEGIEELMLESFPEGVVSQAVTLSDGSKATVTRKVNSQYRILEGASDTFYGWAQDNGRVDLLQRRIAQAALDAEVITSGTMPPGIFVHTEPAIGMTVKREAPAV